MLIPIPVTLNQLLLSREERKRKQKNLVERYSKTLISFMVNMPSAIKDTILSREIHQKGMELLEKLLNENNIDVLYEIVENKVTGTESYIVADYPAKEVKVLLMDLEDQHPIGRLFDFDVIDEKHQMLSRAMFNKERRKCLMCNEEAIICARTQKHTYEQIIFKMEEIFTKYQQ